MAVSLQEELSFRAGAAS